MSILIRGGSLIDGTGSPPRPNAAILVDGETITEVGDSEQVVGAEDVTIIDATGKTMMPGLIDAHDHLCHTGLNLMDRAAAPLSLTMMRVAENIKVTLEAGITTLRDLGGLDLGFKMAVDQGLIEGPRLLVSLSILSRTGGIDDPRLRSGVDFSWKNLPGLPSPVCDGVDECRKRVREVLHAGADVVKFASTGGVSSQTLTASVPTLTFDEMKVMVEEAHLFDKRTSVHAYGGMGLEDAVRAGVDSVEHGAFLCHSPETIKRMAEQNTYFVPTFLVLALHRERGTPLAQQKASEMADDHRRSLEMAMEAGVPIAMGTDAGAYGHGRNAMELKLMTEAGMTPMEAIVASTRTAAACLGLEATIGTLEPGKFADVLIVDGDPLADIRVLENKENITKVIKGGRVVVDRQPSQIN